MDDSIRLEPTPVEPTGPATPGLVAAGLLAVVADPVRWRLLQYLTTAGTTCVCELQPVAAVAGNLLSYHLKVLRDAGLVTTARRGRWVDYTIAPDALGRLHAALPAPDPASAPASDTPMAAPASNTSGGAR